MSLPAQVFLELAGVEGKALWRLQVAHGIMRKMRLFGQPVADRKIAVAGTCLPIFFTGHLIARWEGAVFLAYYMAYTAYLVLAVQRHDLLTSFGFVMTTVVLPLTVLTLLVLAWREWHTPRNCMIDKKS